MYLEVYQLERDWCSLAVKQHCSTAWLDCSAFGWLKVGQVGPTHLLINFRVRTQITSIWNGMAVDDPQSTIYVAGVHVVGLSLNYSLYFHVQHFVLAMM